MTQLDRAQILAYRYQVNGLGARLPEGEFVAATRPGLQDSTPRSGVLSLHARVEGVGPESWQDRRLVQVWGPRGAIYLVPKEDLALFTLGLLPRDPERVKDLETKAKKVLQGLDGRPQRPSSITSSLPDIDSQRELLWVATTGWILPIWDASTTAIYPAEPIEADPEESRLALARRFLHHLGPATANGLQWWTDASRDDTTATLRELAPELATVSFGHEEALMLADDVEAAVGAPAPHGMTLLPPEDVYISRLCGPLLVPEPALHRRLYPRAPLPGALLVDGEVVGTWRRRGRRMSMVPWPHSKLGDLIEQVAEAARRLPLPGEPDNTIVDWYAD